jgi:hypothetical protein
VFKTPLDGIIGLDLVNDVVLEDMHLVNGGVMVDTVELLLNILEKSKDENDVGYQKKSKAKKTSAVSKKKSSKKKKKKLGKVTPKHLLPWNARIDAWSKCCSPCEFPRKIRNLENFGRWKMSEHRLFVMYFLIPLMVLDKQFDGRRKLFKIIARLIRGYRLIAGNTFNPVPEKNIRLARELFAKFFHGMKNICRLWCTYKCHCLFHIPNDVEYFRCRTGALSAYTFENAVRFFREVNCYRLYSRSLISYVDMHRLMCRLLILNISQNII